MSQKTDENSLDINENRRLSNSSSTESELSSTENNIILLRERVKSQNEACKPKNYNDVIKEKLRYRAFDFLNLKIDDYIYNCANGIHKLMYDWELKKRSRILPCTDLKQLILILIHREQEVIEDVIDIIYSDDFDIDSCGCIITKSDYNTINYRKIDRIYIKETVKVNLEKTDTKKTYDYQNKGLNFKYSYPDVYNYIQDCLHISLEYTIYVPSLN